MCYHCTTMEPLVICKTTMRPSFDANTDFDHVTYLITFGHQECEWVWPHTKLLG